MVFVKAHKMTSTQFFYYCPFCPGIHKHGNLGDFCRNRTESRCSHCTNKNNYTDHVNIVINNKTKRFLYSKLDRVKWYNYQKKVRRANKKLKEVLAQINNSD